MPSGTGTSSRGNSRSSASARVTLQQARNTARVIRKLGLGRKYNKLAVADSEYEKKKDKAYEGVQRNDQEMRELPDEIERASMRGQAQKETELEHALETTRPAEKNMYQRWVNRLEKNLKKEAESVMAAKGISNLVPKDHAITDEEIDALKAYFS